jgi:hypothetical protein
MSMKAAGRLLGSTATALRLTLELKLSLYSRNPKQS